MAGLLGCRLREDFRLRTMVVTVRHVERNKGGHIHHGVKKL